MTRIVELMQGYADYHTKRITKITHFIGVPCILLAIQILLSLFWISFISLAWIVVLVLLVYYFHLDRGLAFVAAFFLLPLTCIAQWLARDSEVALFLFFFFFVLGWIAQLIGHYYEGKRPALVDNFSQVFIAPIFLIAELLFALGFRKDLQKK